MLVRWFRLLRTAVIVIGAVFSFFALMEVVRAYQTLRGVHPILGYVFLAVILLLVAWLTGRFILSILSRPTVLIAPTIPDPDKATPRQLRRYARYLCRYLRRLAVNSLLTDEQRTAACKTAEALAVATRSTRDPDALRQAIVDTETNGLAPLLERVDAHAAGHVRDCMRDVMIAVAVSPYKALDLFIVVYRNLAMVRHVIYTYNARPRLREQLQIGWDILAVVATVNYIHMGKNLIEGLGSRVPGIGRFIDDIAQGMGAGFMTTIVGHAAIDRCRAFRGWNTQAAKRRLGAHVEDFYRDVRDLFTRDVLPSLLRRVGDTSRETMDRVVGAIDETGRAAANFVRVPIRAASAAGNSVLTAPGRVTRYSAGRLRRLYGRLMGRPVPTDPNQS